MRYDCALDEFAGCYIDLDDKWTRGEQRSYMLGVGDAYKLAVAVQKTFSLHLVTIDGVVLQKSSDLTVENIDRMDHRLSVWFDTAIVMHIEWMHGVAQTLAKAWREKQDARPVPADRRYACDYPGFEDCFVQISDSWTRGDLRLLEEANTRQLIELLKTKVAAVHLPGIDNPSQFSIESTNALDYTIWQWFAEAMIKGKVDLFSMGEARARRSLAVSVN